MAFILELTCRWCDLQSFWRWINHGDNDLDTLLFAPRYANDQCMCSGRTVKLDQRWQTTWGQEHKDFDAMSCKACNTWITENKKNLKQGEGDNVCHSLIIKDQETTLQSSKISVVYFHIGRQLWHSHRMILFQCSTSAVHSMMTLFDKHERENGMEKRSAFHTRT